MRKALPLLLIAGLAAAILFLPMRFAIEGRVPGLETRSIGGSIWDGRLRGVRYQGVALGDVDAGLDAGSLVRGRPEIRFSRPGTDLRGRARLSRSQPELRELSGTLALPLGATGMEVALTLVDAALLTDAGGRCRAASGHVSAELANVPVIGRTPPLAGQPQCRGGDLGLPLRSAEGTIGLDLTVSPAGAWAADLVVRPASPLVEAALLFAGFARGPEGPTLSLSGERVGA